VQFVSVETVGDGLGWGAIALDVTVATLVVVGKAEAVADEDADGEEAVVAAHPASARLSARSDVMRVQCLGNMVLPLLLIRHHQRRGLVRDNAAPRGDVASALYFSRAGIQNL
jgi:hypothetical protein